MDRHIVDDLSELKIKIDNLHKRLSLLIEPKIGNYFINKKLFKIRSK